MTGETSQKKLRLLTLSTEYAAPKLGALLTGKCDIVPPSAPEPWLRDFAWGSRGNRL